MFILIKMIPLIAIGFIIYGIIRHDWVAVVLGLVLFVIGFIFHAVKRSNVTGGMLFTVYKEIYDLISSIDRTIDDVLMDYPKPKVKLIKGICYIDIIDSACDSDEEFSKIAEAILDDVIFANKKEKKILIQCRTNCVREVQQILSKGNGLFQASSGDYNAKIQDAPKIAKAFAEKKEFPNSINEFAFG